MLSGPTLPFVRRFSDLDTSRKDREERIIVSGLQFNRGKQHKAIQSIEPKMRVSTKQGVWLPASNNNKVTQISFGNGSQGKGKWTWMLFKFGMPKHTTQSMCFQAELTPSWSYREESYSHT